MKAMNNWKIPPKNKQNWTTKCTTIFKLRNVITRLNHTKGHEEINLACQRSSFND
jgi:hypothetical protein